MSPEEVKSYINEKLDKLLTKAMRVCDSDQDALIDA